MKKLMISLVVTMCLCVPAFAQEGLDDVLKIITGGTKGGLTDDTIVKGLLEALQIGTENAVLDVSKLDGYLSNEAIKILLPEDIRKAESLIRLAGGGKTLDDFVTSMNRAAEQAAPEARGLFKEAIQKITFTDARKILKGKDNEATMYFKDKMSDRLFETFQPLVSESLEKTEVTRHYKSLESIASSIPGTGLSNFNLEKYVTQKALDGLFHVVAEEERKIRNDPAARVTDILKTVFGGQ